MFGVLLRWFFELRAVYILRMHKQNLNEVKLVLAILSTLTYVHVD